MAGAEPGTLGLPDTRKLILNASRGFGMVLAGAAPVVVSRIDKRGAAEAAGLRRGDVLLLINGISVAKSSHEEVTRLFMAQPSRVYAITCKQMNVQQIAQLRSLMANSASAVAQQQENVYAALNHARREQALEQQRRAQQLASGAGLRSPERLLQELRDEHVRSRGRDGLDPLDDSLHIETQQSRDQDRKLRAYSHFRASNKSLLSDALLGDDDIESP